MTIGFFILNKVLGPEGLHYVDSLSCPYLEFSTLDTNGNKIILGKDEITNWKVEQQCQLKVHYFHRKGQPVIIYENKGVDENHIIRNTFFPDTPYGRSMALAFVNQQEDKKLASMEKKLRLKGQIFTFPEGTTYAPADKARQILGF
jgi:hypothetical protein